MKSVALFLSFLLISICSTAQAHDNSANTKDTIFDLPPSYTTHVYDSAAVSGYYVFYVKMEGLSFLLMLDKFGNLICYKVLPHNFLCVVEPSGKIMLTGANKDYVLDSTFNIIDSIWFKNNPHIDSHDDVFLANGHVLLLGEEPIIVDAKRHPEWRKDKHHTDSLSVKSGIIQEQDSARNVVFEWHAKDHFNFDDVDTFFFNDGAQEIWTHFNGIALDTDGNILLSSRNFCEITKINRVTGDIMWRWGGNRNQFRFVNCPEPFYGQHNIRRIANGHYTLFDNGQYTHSHGARALEFELNETNKVATLKWSYTYDPDMFSIGQGNVQRLANGNTLVNFGRNFCDSVCFVVVDSTGSKIFELDGFNTYKVLDLPSLPWQLHRPEITRRDSAGVTYLEAEKGHDFYYWNNGSRERVIPVNNDGTYYAFVPCGVNAYISSKKIVIARHNDIKTKDTQKIKLK